MATSINKTFGTSVVGSTHPQYNNAFDRWGLVRNVINNNIKSYLKPIDASDVKRTERYRDDAVLINFTGRTKAGLVGAVFRRNPVVELPKSIAELEDDATGDNLTLAALAQRATSEVLVTGRYGLLVDYPASEDGLTKQEVDNLNLYARIYKYRAENIVNWNTQVINGVSKLCLVVLEEMHSKIGEDGFTWESNTVYRVLRLDNETGIYTQSLYDDEDNLLHAYIPRDYNGKPFDFIPFQFIGSEDNDSSVDNAPLYDLSVISLAHYKNSADYEESVHIVGQPSLFITTDMSSEQFKAANPNGITIGSRKGHNLGTTGSAILLQPNPNQLADEAMKRKEQQAMMIGARLITQQGTNETAEAARIKASGEHSVLSLIAENVESAINVCLEWSNQFMSSNPESDEIVFELNRDFFDKSLTSQDIMGHIQLYNNGIIAASDVRDELRKSGSLKGRDDEDIDEEISTQSPLLGDEIVNG